MTRCWTSEAREITVNQSRVEAPITTSPSSDRIVSPTKRLRAVLPEIDIINLQPNMGGSNDHGFRKSSTNPTPVSQETDQLYGQSRCPQSTSPHPSLKRFNKLRETYLSDIKENPHIKRYALMRDEVVQSFRFNARHTRNTFIILGVIPFGLAYIAVTDSVRFFLSPLFICSIITDISCDCFYFYFG